MFGLVACLAAPRAGGADTNDLQRLLAELERRFADVATVRTSFVQEKRMALFEQPLVVRGRIVIARPNRFAWHVDKPTRFSMVVTGQTMRQWDEDTGAVREMSMAASPVFNIVNEQLTSWFAGRYARLLEEYAVALTAQEPAAVLTFTPRPGTVSAKVVKRVTVALRKDRRYLQSLTIEDTGGDTTALTFTGTVLNQPTSDADWEVAPRGQ